MKNNTKDWIKYGSAMAMIASGIILVFVCFFLTLTVSNGVLAYTGESFGAALTLFGITSYFKADVEDFKTEIRSKLRREIKEDSDANQEGRGVQ